MLKKKTDLKKLKLLVTVVPKGRKEVILDLLEDYYSVNFSFVINGKGTVPNELMNMLGLVSNDREIIFSFVRAQKAKDAILGLEDKFKKFGIHQSMAFTTPLQSIIGMHSYLLLSDLGGEALGK